MGKTKELNIKNQTYYFLDDVIKIKKLHSELLKIDRSHIKTLVFTIFVTSQLKSLMVVKISIA